MISANVFSSSLKNSKIFSEIVWMVSETFDNAKGAGSLSILVLAAIIVLKCVTNSLRALLLSRVFNNFSKASTSSSLGFWSGLKFSKSGTSACTIKTLLKTKYKKIEEKKLQNNFFIRCS